MSLPPGSHCHRRPAPCKRKSGTGGDGALTTLGEDYLVYFTGTGRASPTLAGTRPCKVDALLNAPTLRPNVRPPKVGVDMHVFVPCVCRGERPGQVGRVSAYPAVPGVHRSAVEGFYSEALVEKLAERLSIQDLTEVPEHVRELFVTAHDISVEAHLRTQAAFQRRVDQAISKTVNMPSEATEEDVRKAFLLAYELGCRGVTVYRHGSRAKQVLDSVKSARG